MNKKVLLFACFAMISITVFGQYNRRRGNDPLRSSQNQAPTEKQKEQYKKKVKEREKEYIANFITTLEADDFQKQIIKQTVNDYFKKRVEIYKLSYQSITEREDAIKDFNITHFAELKEMISEADMDKINTLIKGQFNENEAKKKKKKKKRKKKKSR